MNPDFNEIMKQAQAMQEKLQAAQAQLAETEVQGASGGGMVRLTLKGTGELRKLDIDPELLKPEEAEVVADLIIAAHADAKRKLEEAQAETMKAVAGPLAGMPGFPKF